MLLTVLILVPTTTLSTILSITLTTTLTTIPTTTLTTISPTPPPPSLTNPPTTPPHSRHNPPGPCPCGEGELQALQSTDFKLPDWAVWHCSLRSRPPPHTLPTNQPTKPFVHALSDVVTTARRPPPAEYYLHLLGGIEGPGV